MTAEVFFFFLIKSLGREIFLVESDCWGKSVKMLYDLYNNDLQTKIKYLEERKFTEQEFPSNCAQLRQTISMISRNSDLRRDLWRCARIYRNTQTYHARDENQEKDGKHFTACGNDQPAFVFPREPSVGSWELCRPFAGSSTRTETLTVVPNVAKIAPNQCARFLLPLLPSSLGPPPAQGSPLCGRDKGTHLVQTTSPELF